VASGLSINARGTESVMLGAMIYAVIVLALLSLLIVTEPVDAS
jgi:hypothetical protein